MIIIIFTTQRVCRNCNPHGQETNPRSQNPGTPARVLLAPPSRAGHRRTVSDSRVFRSPRPGSGQVRDATPGAKRRTSGEPVSSPLRLLASLVLPSAGGVRAGRSAGTHATEAGTEKSVQAHRRSAGFRAPGAAGRSLPAFGSSGFASPRQIRYHRSSPQYRARLDAQSKKTAVNETLPHSVAAPEWRARYEQLRSDALNRGPGMSSGLGLAVFLRHGLTSWMRACCRVVTPSTSEFAQTAPASSLPCDVRTQAVLILAGILLGNRLEANRCKPTCSR